MLPVIPSESLARFPTSIASRILLDIIPEIGLVIPSQTFVGISLRENFLQGKFLRDSFMEFHMEFFQKFDIFFLFFLNSLQRKYGWM